MSFDTNEQNKITRLLPSAEEFLFAAYSTFTVAAVSWNVGDDDEPHVICLQAAVDNRKEPEDLPLAPWY